ncbi:O-antigen ligase [Pedobacter sp. W3I1]|uniref:O-antigen ligase family protein n=1 Tax=Pedobacter sp. W3I1 TaxID=3042291 RepID=UPI002786ABA7|nr:O-antigen ligase family protein [Pedobacter sp. W3I1]MDQ0640235.1 O-antigen ligase [Pedobacter sp. W3I1]
MKLTLTLLHRAILPIALLYFMFSYQFSFNYEIEINDHYYVLLFCCVSGLIFFASNQGQRQLSSQKWKFIIPIILLPIIIYILGLKSSNEHAVNTLSILLLLLTGLFSCNFSKLELRFMLKLINLCFIIQLVVGIYQILTLDQDSMSQRLYGTMMNSGIYSSFLVICFPNTLYIFDGFVRKFSISQGSRVIIQVTFCIIVSAFILTVVLMTKARTAVLAFLIICILMLWHSYALKIKRFFIAYRFLALTSVLFATTVVFILCHNLYSAKKMSVSGRLLIWKISFVNWDANFLNGLGLGEFGKSFPYWQAKYLAGSPIADEREILNAGENFLAFNEYINFFKELGFIGFFLVIVFLLLLLKSRGVNTFKDRLNLKLTVAAILICSLTSYPLHTNLIIVIFITCVISLVCTSDWKLSAWYLNFSPNLFRGITVAVFSLLAYLLWVTFPKSVAVFEWGSIKKQYTDEKVSFAAIDQKYQILYQKLHDEPNFLTDYAELLMLTEKRQQQSIELLEKASLDGPKARILYKSSQIKMKMKQYSSAISDLRFLSAWIPNKFTYRKDLMRAYFLNHDSTEAITIARQILNMPIKVQSYQVDVIREEAQRVLDQINLNR